MDKLIYILVALLGITNAVFSQSQDWGANEKLAKQHWGLLEQKMIESDLLGAQGSCSWLLKNAPKVSENLYIDASKIYEGLVKQKTKELGKKSPLVAALQDTALRIYDQRIQFFGNEAYVLDRKGMVAYKYLAQRGGQADQLYGLYAKIVELNNDHTTASNLSNFMKVAILRYRSEVLSKNEVLNLYMSLENIIDTEILNYSSVGKSTKSLGKNKNKIEETFSKYVKLDCQDIHTAYQEKFDNEPTVENAKKIYSTMSAQSCTSDELFLKSAKFLIEKEPEYKYYNVLSSVYFNEKKYNEAYEMYEKGLGLTTDSTELSNAYFSMAQIGYLQKNYPQARTNAQKSIAYGKNVTESYNLIGSLYESSYASCKSDNPLVTKGIFIAAYNMYASAGNTERMAAMRKMFPTVEELFMQNQKEGDVVKVGCWMNLTVKLKGK